MHKYLKMMHKYLKIMTILGTRPEIIRLSLIIPELDRLCDHVLIHTGQNYDPQLSEIFFKELGIRQPDTYLGVKSDSFGAQVGEILQKTEEILLKEKPHRLLILGDTNSGLASIVAKRLGIPVYHMEAGNRCFDDRVPEEVNRRIIDQCSDFLMPYTERGRQNLIREGFHPQHVYVIGNPIYEVINHYQPSIDQSDALARLGLKPKGYFLVTMHRAENVDFQERLADLAKALDQVQREYALPVVCSLHPHTRARLGQFGIALKNPEILFLQPLGFFDFIALEKNALCLLSDSGTVQEECCIFRVPAVTLRDTTERPETVECGSNILSGVKPDSVLRCIHAALAKEPAWTPPREYLVENVSDTVTRILLS